MDMITVLVTGGAGYIGSHACKALALAGYQPVCVDNLSLGHADAVKWGPLEVGDIRNGAFLNKVIAKYAPEAVMHFAASSNVGESVTDPAKYYSNNVVGSLNLLEAVRQNGIEHFILSSTCATYGIPESLPIVETSPQNPINPYGATKLAVEHALADYGRAYGLKWASMRYFNAAGADLEGELGERHTPETHVIPLAIMAAFSHSPAFNVLGTDYPTPDGSAIRDYIHVTDLAEAHVKGLDYLRAGGESSAFNLGTGIGTTVLEVLQAVQTCTGRRLDIRRQPRRAGDPAILYAAANKAAELLNWHPQYREIETIVGSAVSWFRHNLAA
ncbi:UDP-glucose 4-epimerase GalE [Labrys miyagiensis]|nr:UDP-glucose 4-epimerase GalE [Labrys miyagiensis]